MSEDVDALRRYLNGTLVGGVAADAKIRRRVAKELGVDEKYLLAVMRKNESFKHILFCFSIIDYPWKLRSGNPAT